MRRHSLSLAFGALFLGTLIAQAFVGHADFNAAQLAHNSDPITLWRYVRSSEFGVDVLENWQSEYLQFSLFILGTVWLIQRGSPESKPCPEAVRELDDEIQPSAVTRAQVFVTTAKVDLADGQSAFLELTARGWRVAAAGCRPTGPDEPYQCVLEA